MKTRNAVKALTVGAAAVLFASGCNKKDDVAPAPSATPAAVPAPPAPLPPVASIQIPPPATPAHVSLTHPHPGGTSDGGARDGGGAPATVPGAGAARDAAVIALPPGVPPIPTLHPSQLPGIASSIVSGIVGAIPSGIVPVPPAPSH